MESTSVAGKLAEVSLPVTVKMFSQLLVLFLPFYRCISCVVGHFL